ncbi:MULTISPECIES: NfeD family protein [Exiguobacterium]|uniref:NfeD-like family protein n=1 Tax=Exiguobacterium oxidotolerans TaxID=223958 RepID=A0A653IGV0_9BACL|nr:MULTISPECIES: NfeD family protein [Exiguobacterium]ASI34779.1 nfeD-like family protein [Exiguobacterium sp. N4-1P]VWX38044.1 NfeD-like family protein [Exiguobacterium oxidotolerans]
MSFSLGMILAVFLVGVVMLLIEIFVTGFGIFGVVGIGAVLASLIMAGATVGQVGLAIGLSVFLSLAAGYWAYRRIKSNQSLLWRGLILTDSTSSEKGYLSHEEKVQLNGKEGISLTPLRPAGTIEIDGNRIDAVTEGNFIGSGERIIVKEVTHGRVVVRVQTTKEESIT